MSARYDHGLMWHDQFIRGIYEMFKPLTWKQYNALCNKIENQGKNL